jgi:hypothetical protein
MSILNNGCYAVASDEANYTVPVPWSDASSGVKTLVSECDEHASTVRTRFGDYRRWADVSQQPQDDDKTLGSVGICGVDLEVPEAVLRRLFPRAQRC